MTGTARPTSRRRAALRVGASIALLAGLCLLLPVDELVAALSRVPAHAWPLALAGYLSIHLVGSAKWRLLVNASGAGLRYPSAVRCYFGGLFANIFLPSIVGGDLVRAGLALRLTPNKGAVLFGSFVDRLLDILALALVAGIGALTMPRHLDPQSLRIFTGLVLLFAVAGSAVVLVLALLPARRFAYRWRRHLVRGRYVVAALLRSPGTVAAALAIGMSLQIALALLNAWLARQTGADIALGIWLFVWPLAKISAILPVAQGGIGLREAALVALLLPFGVPAVTGMAAGLVFEAVVIGGGLAAGVVSFVLGRGRRATPVPDAAPPASGPITHPRPPSPAP